MREVDNIDLTQGSIFKGLLKLALPIMITSFVQMAYNMTDMYWVGRAGADYVAAVGAAGNFIWLAESIILMTKIGGQAKIGQAVGAKDTTLARDYIKVTLQLSILISIFLAAIFIFFPKNLIMIYKFKSEVAINSAISYMQIVGIGLVFYFSAKVITSIFSALGNTKVGLISTGIGLILNMILDPILIFTLNLGVKGAALATVIAQIVVFIVFLAYMIKQPKYFTKLSLIKGFDRSKALSISKIGYPAAANMSVMAGVGVVLGGIISAYGAFAVAAQKIGAQVEAISWMTADGFSVASNAFVAQNYGAGKVNRVKRGFNVSIKLMLGLGVVTTFIIVFFSREIMGLFLSEPLAKNIGSNYLVIMGFSQIAMCVELVLAGALAGLGYTFVPGVVAIIFSVLRVPLSLILTATPLGVSGVWWAITISSLLKGMVIFSVYKIMWRKFYAKINS